MSPQSYRRFTKPDLPARGNLLYADATWNPPVLSYHNSCIYWYTHVPLVSFLFLKMKFSPYKTEPGQSR